MVNRLHHVHCLLIDLAVFCSYNWVATGSIDQTLIIWDLARQAIRSTCEHDVGAESVDLFGPLVFSCRYELTIIGGV